MIDRFYEIDMTKNIRTLLEGTIYAHPDDIKKAVKATTPEKDIAPAKKKKKK